MRSRRVVITGLGVISPVGLTKDSFWESLLSGRAGFSPVTSFDAAGYRTRVGCEVRDFRPRDCLPFAFAAARQALKDAGIAKTKLSPKRCGVALGTTSGDELRMERAFDSHLSGGTSERAMRERARPSLPGSIPARLARKLGFHGPNVMLTTACAAANSALAYAYEKIIHDRADLMLAGGVDVFSPVLFAGFNRLLSIAPQVCAPFSKDRKGLIPGEGCAILVIESLDQAMKRGRRPYAEFIGYGMSADAHHVTQPQERGVARAISACLSEANLKAEEVDYISAHGTGTPASDRVETAAIKLVFGARASRVPVSSIKSMLGHAMGAATAFEAAACCLSLETGLLPPTANFQPGDAECDLDYVPNRARKTDPKIVISNGFAFGGGNVVVALARPTPKRPPRRQSAVRVVVTGIGTVTEEDPISLAESLLPNKDLSFIDRPIAYALCAVKRALDDAGVDPEREGERMGVVLDSSGEMESLFKFYSALAREGPQGVEPRLFPNILANAAASRASIAFGLRLANVSIAGSFPGGESAVVWAHDFIARARSGIVLAGGVDRGASVMVLETLEDATRRGARILAEIEDYEESFQSAAARGRNPGCFCLAGALKKVASARRPLKYLARGLWGGRIALSLRPV